MIQAIILDVDGVIVGEKAGYNSPNPHFDVVSKLHKIREKGVPIVLCTAKPYYAIADIINASHLNNPHITDGGAVIIDPVNNIVIQELRLGKDLAKDILKTLIDERVYTEFYTLDGYFAQRSQITEITKTHAFILQREPTILESLTDESSNYNITKIMPIADNPKDKERVSKILEQYKDTTSINWGLHPVALPHQFAFIVNKDTSKKDAARKCIENLKIPFESVLGIGDTTSDWKFIELCGHGATLENGSKDLKELIKTKEEGKFFIGKSIDENGILDVFDYFNL